MGSQHTAMHVWKSRLNLAQLPIESHFGFGGEQRRRERRTGRQGLEAGSPRGGILTTGRSGLMAFSWSVWACVVMHRRRGAGQRSAGMELGGMRPQSAAMHLGIVVESCAVADRFARDVWR